MNNLLAQRAQVVAVLLFCFCSVMFSVSLSRLCVENPLPRTLSLAMTNQKYAIC